MSKIKDRLVTSRFLYKGRFYTVLPAKYPKYQAAILTGSTWTRVSIFGDKIIEIEAAIKRTSIPKLLAQKEV